MEWSVLSVYIYIYIRKDKKKQRKKKADHLNMLLNDLHLI